MQSPQRSQRNSLHAPARGQADGADRLRARPISTGPAPAPSASSASANRGATFEAWGFPVLLAVVTSALVAGWIYRDELGIEAERGAGYWLGIAGLSCVGLLLLYPLRKRLTKWTFLGSVPGWFHLHMALGLVAPTFILFHAGFRTGSINAAVALISMLVVAGSGVFGRMLYVRVHRGLTGKRAEVRAMASDAGLLRQTLVKDFSEVADIAEDLEVSLRTPRSNVFSAFGYALSMSSRIAGAKRQMLRSLKRGASRVALGGSAGRAAAKRLRRDGGMLVKRYCRTLKRAAYLTFFERLFALWHIMHLPLFFLMLVAAVIHVVAVHLY